ncbi:monooxygenase [Fusarium denticulatum]|uniref:Monooxygenase n=1 Tax=Fusarium denticulatum TaxID=48507 RepID=A0A8H5TWB3_9HYPO|nr:monooxygenase [Fusarium denticulatum]
MTINTTVLDALIVGGGFGGVYQLKRLREEGYSVKLVDMASDYAGIWFWNRYPGARVDSAIPHYEYSDPELWRDWNWTQRFPGSAELREYFSYVAKKWDLRKDTFFNTCISKAVWDEEANRWQIESKDGKKFVARYLLLNTGFAAKRHTPDWKDIDMFSGLWIHPSYWPAKEPDLKGKKIAVIGTGSTGVQLAQELSQIEYSQNDKLITEERYKEVFKGRHASFGGFDFNFYPYDTFSDDTETRRAVYEEPWSHGDFKFWLANYQDMIFREDANAEAYKFWKSKVRSRVKDPCCQEILAPEKQPYSFGCKRISLENGFYEIFNQPNVSLVDVNATPVVEVTERGIKTSEKEWEFDVVVCATGFDAITGGLKDINIQGVSGVKLADKWEYGAKTYLGMAVAGFPNMLFTYGPQAPTALCNGPTRAESQGEFIVKVMKYMSTHGRHKIDACEDAEAEWAANVQNIANASLLPNTKSWYMGDNILGTPRECLIYLGGVPTYTKTLKECTEDGFKGFQLK